MTTFGWDMSHYDRPDIGTAWAEGIRFFTHKAGGDKVDPELAEWWKGVSRLEPDEVLLGAYWVLYPGSGVQRAQAFLSTLDRYCPGWRDQPFILQVDCEKWNGDPNTVPSKSTIQVFCDYLSTQMPKLRPIVYAPEWVYDDTLTGLNYPLWASSYVSSTGAWQSLYPGDSSKRWAAYSGQVPVILQYSDKATVGGQSTCDVNAFRGTLAELQALVAPGWESALDAQAVWSADVIPVQGKTATWVAGATLGATYDAVIALRAQLTQLLGKDFVDEPALVAGVLAGLTPELFAAAFQKAGLTAQALADLLPAELANELADIFATRMQA